MTVAEGGTLQIATSTLLANDSDPENAALSVTAVGNAVNGSVSLSSDKATVSLPPRWLRDHHRQLHLHRQ